MLLVAKHQTRMLTEVLGKLPQACVARVSAGKRWFHAARDWHNIRV